MILKLSLIGTGTYEAVVIKNVQRSIFFKYFFSFKILLKLT